MNNGPKIKGPTLTEFKRNPEVLRPSFERYIEIAKMRARSIMWVDVDGWAMSLEGIHRFVKECKASDSILECGAGASTWILRQLFKTVHTVESDRRWHAHVRQMCEQENLSTRNFHHTINHAPACNAVLYDYDEVTKRPDHLPVAWSKTKRVLYVDDADDRPDFTVFRRAVDDWATAENVKLIECPEAADSFGRWGVIARKDS